MKKSGMTYYKELLGYYEMPAFLIKYLDTPCLTRLKNVGYFCGMDYASKDIYQFKEYISRYDHSVTTALLTWKLTKDMKSTIAALFHDISTPCFSHVIDYMNKDYERQESTERYTSAILKSSRYLEKHLKEDDVDIEEVINFKKYPIVDNNRPKLCADRLDGVILTGYGWIKDIQKEDMRKILSELEVYKNENEEQEIGFKSKEIANKIVECTKNANIACHSKEDQYMMELLASITNLAIEHHLISYRELYNFNEKSVMYILKRCADKEILEKLAQFEHIKKEEIPNLEPLKIKTRTINPLVKGKRLY